MAGCTGYGDRDAEPDRILIVIDPRLDRALNQPRGCALAPQDLPRPAVVMRLACLQGQAQGLGVHPA
jgi:hypothetical protein